MSNINPFFVEEYQKIIQKDPKSKTFAILSEAYRKMKLFTPAMEVCQKGIKFNPKYSGGYVAYVKVLIEMQKYDEGLKMIEEALKLSPDNMLAHKLKGDLHIAKRSPKKALLHYKKVLLYSPNDQKIANLIKNWEFIAANNFNLNLFEKLKTTSLIESASSQTNKEAWILSLSDSFMSLNLVEQAKELLEQASLIIKSQKIEDRLTKLNESYSPEIKEIYELKKRKKVLENFLHFLT